MKIGEVGSDGITLKAAFEFAAILMNQDGLVAPALYDGRPCLFWEPRGAEVFASEG